MAGHSIRSPSFPPSRFALLCFPSRPSHSPSHVPPRPAQPFASTMPIHQTAECLLFVFSMQAIFRMHGIELVSTPCGKGCRSWPRHQLATCLLHVVADSPYILSSATQLTVAVTVSRQLIHFLHRVLIFWCTFVSLICQDPVMPPPSRNQLATCLLHVVANSPYILSSATQLTVAVTVSRQHIRLLAPLPDFMVHVRVVDLPGCEGLIQ